MAKEPERRYATARDLADDLRAIPERRADPGAAGVAEREGLAVVPAQPVAGRGQLLAMAALVAVAVISLAFAVEETRTKNQIKGLANNLQSSLNKSERLAGELKTALKESEIRLAALNFERGPYRVRERGDGPGPAAAGRELALGRRGR